MEEKNCEVEELNVLPKESSDKKEVELKKNRDKNWLSIAAFIISLMALFFSWKNNEISMEGVRPVLELIDFKATFNDSRVKLKYKVNNTGKSTAVINKFEIELIQLGDGDYVKKVIDNNATSKILYMDGSYEGNIDIPRFIEDSNSNMKLDIANANPNAFVFKLKYSIRGKWYFPPFRDYSVFTEAKWE